MHIQREWVFWADPCTLFSLSFSVVRRIPDLPIQFFSGSSINSLEKRELEWYYYFLIIYSSEYKVYMDKKMNANLGIYRLHICTQEW